MYLMIDIRRESEANAAMLFEVEAVLDDLAPDTRDENAADWLRRELRTREARAEAAEQERDQQERFKWRANERADRAEAALREIAEDTDHPSWRKAKAIARAALAPKGEGK